MNNGINLLNYKNKEEVKSAATVHKKIRVASIVLLFTVSAFSVMIFILIALSPLPELNKQYNFASFTLSQSVSDVVRLGLVNERADTIKNIIDKRPQYDKVLEDVQKKLPDGVTVEKIRIKEKDINLEVSSDSLSEVDDFLNKLSKDDNTSIKLSRVMLSKLTIENEDNKFVISIDINIL